MYRLSTALVMITNVAWAADSAEFEFFEKKIRPVLVSECYQCHSKEEKVKGELRLDWKGGWQKGGESGATIIPGRVGKSLLIQAIRHADADLKMPPKKKLTPEQIADFEKWVAMGAPDPRTNSEATAEEKKLDLEAARQFWAFQPVKKPSRPILKNKSWALTDIDRFILSELEKKELNPVKDADHLTLLRRLYFDLIGLPPTSDQMKAFVKAAQANKKNAVEKVVDELLASPHFGERWGRHWLDVVRFSESTGGGRTLLMKEAWRYRDYVIDTFNADKPYTEFIREQIAGDLIDGGTLEEQRERLTATAFLLLGPTNYELQDKTVLEMDIVDEQMDTMGKAFMALTIGCARCHDHKFDPIRTEDYYGMAGIFKSTKSVIHSNVSTWNKRTLPISPEDKKTAKQQAVQIADLKKEINRLKKKTGSAPNKLPSVQATDLPGIVVDNPDAKIIGQWAKSNSVENHVGSEYLYNSGPDSKVVYPVKFTKGGKYEVRISFAHHPNRSSKTLVTVRHNDGENTFRINQKKKPAVDGYFQSLGFFEFQSGQWDAVEISTMGNNGAVIADAVQFLLEGSPVVAKKEAEPKKKPAKQNLSDDKAKLTELEKKLKTLESKRVKQPQIIAASELDNPGDIQIAIRGNVHNAGPKTPRRFIQVLNRGSIPKIKSKSSGRMELANWMASAEHPLTARVFSNRVWHHLFGKGLVASVDNFGHMGQLPTNQTLLDHLANRFTEQDWSVKKLIREIVLSRTYQLSSNSGEQTQVDLENKLHWRQNRRRLQAETIRDSILAVSNQLDTKMGGPTIKEGTKIEYGYEFEGTRRSIYTPVFRNTPLEILAVFDFADPNLVVGERTTSNVPTQALYLMNSPFVREQADNAAKVLLAENLTDQSSRINQAYRRTLGRDATSSEREILLSFLDNQRDLAKAWSQIFHGLYASPDFRYLN